MSVLRAGAVLVVVLYALWQSSSSSSAAGTISLAALDTTYTEDFNTLAASGTSSTVPNGWAFVESGTNANTTYTAGTGSGNTGDTYSFGAAGNLERAFGGLQSGSLIPTIGASFSNNTGTTITALDVAYTGEQWRLGFSARGADRLDFQYSTDATSLNTGTWTNVDALDFSSPITVGTAGLLDGNAAPNRQVLSATISSLNIPNGATLWIRWSDFNVTNADDGLAVDDFSLTPHGGGLPTLSIANVSITEGDAGTTDATFTVSVSTAAHSGVTFDIATADGPGPDAATIADGDYAAHAETAQFIPAGSTTYFFTVAVNGDVTVEADETFLVNVTNVTGATVADGQATGTITNDDVPPPVTTDVVVSQIYGGGGNSGATFTNDFVELFNRGTSTVSLTGWSLQYLSATGTGTWSVTPLAGSIPPGGYYLIQEAQGAGGTTPLPAPDAVGSIGMAAGAGKVALRSTLPALTGACPTGLVDLVGYGATANCFEGGGPAATLSNTTAAFRKRSGCFDSNNNNIDFSVNAPAPRNSASPSGNCFPIAAEIHDIQGSGTVSPYAGQFVSTSGIVTAKKANGFFLQEPDSAWDGDPMTSEALFVFTSAGPAVAVGDAVGVQGTAGEFFGLTQIESSLPGDVSVGSTGNAVPVPLDLTTAVLDPNGTPSQLEPFEAMRMHAASLTSVAPTNDFGETATVLTGVPRPLREPGIGVSDPVPPDPTSGVPDCCIPRFDENPERIVIDSDGLAGALPVSVTSNVVFSGITGPLDFTFGEFKVLPETPPAVTVSMSGIPVPDPAAGEFTVGGFNIENFANGETQRKKAALAIRQLMRSPDVIGHIEILDLATLQALATQVNADTIAAGGADPEYQAVLIPAPAGGTQNVGFLVKTSRVRIDSVSQERASETYINPITGLPETLHDRPPLVLRATADADGLNPRPMIIVVNHTRSFIDIELVGGDGPRVRAKRTAQAASIAGLLQELQSDNADVPILSIGDYNAYQFNDGYTDPIAILKGMPTPDDQVVVDGSPDLVEPNFVNLTDGLPAEERYSFIFEGTPQAIDHMLVNTAALPLVQRYAIARGNADFPAVPGALFADDVTRPERSSDHDMPVAYLQFPPPSADLAVQIVADTATAQAGSNVTYTITVTNNGPSPAQNVVVTGTLPPPVTFPLVASGASETIVIVAAVSCAAPDGSSIVQTATVSSDTGDPDGSNNASEVTVTAVNPPPSITGAAASRSELWPANHKLVDVQIAYNASDTCGSVQASLSVTSNEPVSGTGPEDVAPDWEIVNAHLVRLRAERVDTGTGRVYTVTITAVDAAGGTSQTSVNVTVPHNQ